MSPKHTSPERPRRKGREQYQARAPYNFVPLPEQFVPGLKPLEQDTYVYDEEACSGWIDCIIETRSPTYIRGMMTESQFTESGREDAASLTNEQKEQRAPFFSGTDQKVGGQFVPQLPGSSLRGMIRGLVEILGHGRMRWVADAPAFMFRAVAASKYDPLRDPYRDVIGPFARNVEAGYLYHHGDNWWIAPAYKWPTGESYIKVKDEFLLKAGLPGYIGFNDPKYKPQLHRVSVDPEIRQGRRGKYVFLKAIGPSGRYRFPCSLACSGNMLETASSGKTSPRARQTLVPYPNKNATPIRIDNRAVEDYLRSLTPFQKEELPTSSEGLGALKHESLIFYVKEPGQDLVVYFGHSPNFRIPAILQKEGRAATPADFVPDALRDSPDPDLAEAIFGWVSETNIPMREQARAGRVFVEDAWCLNPSPDIWYSSKSVTPQVLATPKPTSFQHYLIQDKKLGHDPENLPSLAHYGTSPEETQIRGYKLYWHRGQNPPFETKESAEEVTKHASQYTRIRPLKPGVQFQYRVRFDSLHPQELGALLWAIQLPVGDDRIYCHKLGMGKPLGMGALAVTNTTLILVDRPDRYQSLFKDDLWHEGTKVEEEDGKRFVDAFEEYLLKKLGEENRSFADLERIKMLLAMLEWHESDRDWLEETRYMEIEHGPRKVNEYKERPVLPDPLHIAKRFKK